MDKQYTQGQRDLEQSTFHDWPEQHKPGDRKWALLRKALKRCFAPNNQQLDDQLNLWIDGYRN